MTLFVNKKLTAFAVGFMALVAAMLIIFCSPSTSYAATLGSEEPQIYFTYEKDGVEVDGNNLLKDNTYDVKIWVNGLEAISTFQITATVDGTVTCATEPTALMSDSYEDITSMGYVLDGESIVFGFVSENDNYSLINSEATLVASLSMTFAQDGSAENHISVSANPNLTFAQTDYADGYDDSYALVDETQYVDNAWLYPMGCTVVRAIEENPDGHTVTGSLVVMTNVNGATDGVAVAGTYYINVYSDEARTQLVNTVESEESVNTYNLKTNTFVIEDLADGTYYLSISNRYAFTRDDITLVVNGSDITAQAIPIIACNFNEDEYVSALDAVSVYAEAAGDGADYCNLDGDEYVSALDAIIVYSCASGIFNYDPIIIN